MLKIISQGFINTLRQEPMEYATLFMSLIGGGQQAATKIDRIQYALSLIDELLTG